MKKIIALCLLTFYFVTGYSQQKEREILLDNVRIQLQCTEAIDSLYNGNFLVAEKQFGWIREEYPDHPLGYFLMALSNWWKILPNEDVKKYDEKFFYYIDETIVRAEKLYKEDKKNPEASFFLAAAYGFRGRRIADNGSILKTIHPARESVGYMTKNTELGDSFGPEFLFGHGLYNFFREWLPKERASLKPILTTFRKGDTKKGLEQLEACSRDAFYTRIEAQVFLMDIYSNYGVYEKVEKEDRKKGDKKYKKKTYYGKAYTIARDLYYVYPNNKYIERRLAEISLDYPSNERFINFGAGVAKKILAIEEKSPGTYGKEAVRGLNYRLARYYLKGNEISEASIPYYTKMVEVSNEIDLGSAYYTMTSYIKLAEYYEEKGDKTNALKYYELFLDNYSDSNKDYKRNKKKKAKNYVKKHGEKKFLGLF